MKVKLTEEQYRRVILKEDTQNKIAVLLDGTSSAGKSKTAKELNAIPFYKATDPNQWVVIDSDYFTDDTPGGEERRLKLDHPNIRDWAKRNDSGIASGIHRKKGVKNIPPNPYETQYIEGTDARSWYMAQEFKTGPWKKVIFDSINSDIKKYLPDVKIKNILLHAPIYILLRNMGTREKSGDSRKSTSVLDQYLEKYVATKSKPHESVGDPNNVLIKKDLQLLLKNSNLSDTYIDDFIERLGINDEGKYYIKVKDEYMTADTELVNVDDKQEEYIEMIRNKEGLKDNKEYCGKHPFYNCYQKAIDEWWNDEESKNWIELFKKDGFDTAISTILNNEWERLENQAELVADLTICYSKCGSKEVKDAISKIGDISVGDIMGKNIAGSAINYVKKWWDKVKEQGGEIVDNLTIKESVSKRKIILTESQHRRMVKEQTKQEVLADKLSQELAGADLKKTMDDLTTLYAYSEEEIINNPVLMNLVKEKMLKEIRERYYISRELEDKYGTYFGAVGLAAAKEIFKSNDNLYSKFLQLSAVAQSIPWSYSEHADKDMVIEMRDGLIYDTLQYLFDNFTPRDALKRASIMSDRRGVDYEQIYPLVKQFADKHGITLFSKHRGMTFAKKDGMMRSLVNYLKDVEPKTKAGFLEYINSRGRSHGQHTVFWGAAKNAGLVVPVRNGRKITYQLGPNYESWENDNLVAF